MPAYLSANSNAVELSWQVSRDTLLILLVSKILSLKVSAVEVSIIESACTAGDATSTLLC